MTYKNIAIKETGKGFSFDVVTHNWLRPNTYRKNTVTNSLAIIQSTITWYLNEGAEVQNGIVYLGKGKEAK